MGALSWIPMVAVTVVVVLVGGWFALSQQSTYTGVVSSFTHSNYAIAQFYTLEYYGGSSASWFGTLNVTVEPGMNCSIDTVGWFWAKNLTCAGFVLTPDTTTK